MPSHRVVPAIFLVLSGCTHLQLERSTLHQVSTQTDLQYRMVLNNMALMATNVGAMPYFSLLATGQVQITDAGSTTDMVIPNSLSGGVWSGNYSVMGSRNIQENWNLTPLTDPDKIKRMRCAYQYVLGAENCDCLECQKLLESFFCKQDCINKPAPTKCGDCLACILPRGWFHVGRACDVPQNACYVGHYCDTYAWVDAGGVDGLTRFTMAILDIATVTSHEDSAQVKRIYAGDPADNRTPLTTEVVTTEIPPQSILATARPAPKQRMMSNILNSPNVPAVPRP
ncbi:MAG: hypothetical protein ACJ8C4_15435 [Gemmataceae bacterium]